MSSAIVARDDAQEAPDAPDAAGAVPRAGDGPGSGDVLPTLSPATQGALSPSVLVAAAVTGLGAVPTLLGFTSDRMPDWALAGVGWTAFGIAAALLLDRDPRSRAGWTFTALSAVPLALQLARTTADGRGLVDGFDAGLPAAALVVVATGWSAGPAVDRTSRRRLVWLATWCSVLLGLTSAVDLLGGARSAAVVVSVAMWAFAALTTRLLVLDQLRPVDEPLVDVVVVAGGLVLGAAAGLAVRWIIQRAGLPQSELSGAFVAVVTAALGWSGGLWLRRGYLERTYGSGVLSPTDVAAITSGLHPRTDPRELLGKAAAMVAAATGHRDVRIVLGADDVDLVAPWVAHPLLVAGDRVGSLLVRPTHPEGPELRQARVVDQMLPTVGLVARAVSLAVEADHARQDVARERDAERARILGDLHDGVGPVLAGMSMRVQAELRRSPTPVLESLAAELADARGDLRRIVSGLTPSALHDADIVVALERLVASFADTGHTVRLTASVDHPLVPEVAVAVYRSVAEGLTNALRHGSADRVDVAVTSTPAGDGHRRSAVRIVVHDDGTGGPVVPGVGLTSLRRRAEDLGGTLQVGPGDSGGVRLRVDLPTTGVRA